jgi:hypothetical protein
VDGGAASQSASSTRKAAAPAKNRQIPISTGSTSGAAATTAAGRLSEAQVTSFRSTFTTWLKAHVEAMRWNSKITSRADIRRILEVLKGEVAGGTQSSAGSVISGVFACRINGLGLPYHNSCGIAVLKTDYHLRNKYRLVLLNGATVIVDINATNRMQKATPGTTDICVPLAWEDYFGVLLQTHEELAHMLTGRKLHDKVKGRYVCGS